VAENYATPQRSHLCDTCPFARKTSKEYLDTRGDNGERFLAQANLDAVLPCHSEHNGRAVPGVCQQCAGAAKFRANIGVKLHPSLGVLPPDTETVFATNAELLAHHKGWTVEQAEAFLQNGKLEELKMQEWRLAISRNRIAPAVPEIQQRRSN
jgi:hypothetical protein